MTADRPSGAPDFAALLREQRRSAGLTQAELARHAGVAVRTVREVERGRTARPHRTTAILLARALRLTGSERTQFLAAARGDVTPVPPALAAATAPGGGTVPLPAAIPLVGRDEDLARLATLLVAGAPGPVSLVGMAGVGKTGLAIALAHRVAAEFPGGVVGLVVDEQEDVPGLLTSIAVVFGVARPDEVAGRLAGRRALLLLDAVDRAPEAARQALDRLPPEVQVLTTGRTPLHVSTEVAEPVAPLALPPAAGSGELSEVAAYPAAALFLARLAQVRPEPLAPDEVPALVGLVRRLGGLPLALELAAARGRLLRVPEILRRYGDRVLDLGAEGDHPLREAVAASYRLLSPAERRALRRLAVFRNRWSVDLAEQLLADGDPLPLLDRLVSLGLASVRGAREYRFRLLDVVRDFAFEQAERHGELPAARRAHAAVMADLAQRIAPALAGPELLRAAARLDDLASDVWAALNHAANDDPPTALRLAACLPRWWRLRGRDVVGRRWLRRLLDDPRTAAADPVVRAWAAVGVARLALEHGEGTAEVAAAEQAVVTFHRVGDAGGEIAGRTVLHALWVAEGNPEQARRHTEAALAVATRTGRARDATLAHTNLTWHDIRVGDLSSARRRLVSVDRLAAQLGDRRLRLLAAANLAEVARLQQRYDEAADLGRRVLARLGELGDPGHRRRVSGTVGQALAALGRVEEAEQVLASLRGVSGADGAGDGWSAVIEARLAELRGDRPAAAEWFAVAVSEFDGGADRRDLLEALVGLAGCLSDPVRRSEIRSRVAELCRAGGFVLLPHEQEKLG